MRQHQYGSTVTTDKHIHNYSSYVLSDCEKFVLSRGLNFCISPPGTNSASVFAEIELLYMQLNRHSLAPAGNITYLKAPLADLAQSFINTTVDSQSF